MIFDCSVHTTNRPERPALIGGRTQDGGLWSVLQDGPGRFRTIWEWISTTQETAGHDRYRGGADRPGMAQDAKSGILGLVFDLDKTAGHRVQDGDKWTEVKNIDARTALRCSSCPPGRGLRRTPDPAARPTTVSGRRQSVSRLRPAGTRRTSGSGRASAASCSRPRVAGARSVGSRPAPASGSRSTTTTLAAPAPARAGSASEACCVARATRCSAASATTRPPSNGRPTTSVIRPRGPYWEGSSPTSRRRAEP